MNYAGLLTVDLPDGLRRGQLFKIVVRQVTNAVGTPQRGQPPVIAARAKEASQSRQIHWRRVRGSFQISIPVGTAEYLLESEERRLSIFRYIQQSIPTSDRWHPVFQRYVSQIGERVKGFGGNPATVLPSPIGVWKHPKSHPCEKEHEHRISFTGKVAALVYDRFGDFECFLLDTEDGERSFRSREHEVEELVRRAWAERIVTTIAVECAEPHRPMTVILRSAPRPFQD